MGGEGFAFADFEPERLGRGLRERCELWEGQRGCRELGWGWRAYYTQTAGVADGAGEFGVADPSGGCGVSFADEGVVRGEADCMPPWTTGTERVSQGFCEAGFRDVLLMPSFLVSSVLNGISAFTRGFSGQLVGPV